ncbi:MAG: hypothetical protein ACR2NW_06410, partial [Thermodesulfobacteriota bacterium]
MYFKVCFSSINILFFISFFILSTGIVNAQSDKERIKKLEEQLNQVTRELQEMKQEGSSENSRLDEIEKNLSVLAEELKDLKTESVGGEVDIELKEVFGGAPGASKVYLKPGRGLSIGGYGELLISRIPDDGNNIVDAQRVVLYTGYKFTDHIIFNSEIEFEHATTESNLDDQDGSVSVEFAYLDFLIKDYLNIRGGLLLVPFGIINEIHEPTTFYGVFRPSVERQIIPTTWRENGAGFLGDIDLQSAGTLSYKAYVMNSVDSRGFNASNNRGLRTRGSRSRFNDVAFAGRLEYDPYPGIKLGGSIYLGDTGQDVDVDNPDSPFNGQKIDGFFQMYELDAQLQYRGFNLRTLAVWTFLDQADLINANNGFTGDESVGDEQFGWYVVAAYNILTE